MPQFDLFPIHTTAYEPLAKFNHKLDYQIEENKILRNFLFFGISEDFLFRKLIFHNN